MREIKFRVFVKHLGQLADVLTIDFLEREVEIYLVDRDEVRYYPFDEDEIVLLQFTGLKDRTDKEIYEGDIVKFHFPNPYNTVVKFINGHFAFYKGKRMMVDPYYYTNHVWSYAEVIGNIFEHKHLLEADS